ncbi:hypothetical protein [Chamaesiphon minutus]|uniref:Uncharacterized protein n=1 Tax=Chamaesiphon minutus (strain ATCC 27169 / PCC 6605) TaxID=1173020 RepID=K9UDS0_CHAP6|nr:hypothetical protein [Chamaesiphon minutus]AFY92581.1 hypothetical protein Cha6605_1404 [Chamaesiphon minutus PCC 6605]
MINYVSSGGELVDRALQTLLTCYGASYQQHVFHQLPDWQLDELMCDRQAHAIVSECDPVKFNMYLERLPLSIDTRAHWWQILPPCHRELQEIVSLVAGFTNKYRHLKYSFFLSQAYTADIWKTIFSRVDSLTLKTLGQKNILVSLSDIDLQKLNYTGYDRQVRSCLIYPRADRSTNAKVAELLSTIGQIQPFFHYSVSG